MIELRADLKKVRFYDKRHFVHPWEALETIGHQDRTIAGMAEGIYVTDEAGNRLVDGPGGMWCIQIGYGRREMADGIRRTIEDLHREGAWQG